MWRCFDNSVGVFVICALAFTVFCIVCTVFFYCFVYVYLFLFVLAILVEELLPSENSIAVMMMIITMIMIMMMMIIIIIIIITLIVQDVLLCEIKRVSFSKHQAKEMEGGAEVYHRALFNSVVDGSDW